ncbi:MAG: inositol monophosphatase, partial [Alphaproteobacteria bacterium]|nr:inositol monophosphatase [Alphaproteobacteria bacterium]
MSYLSSALTLLVSAVKKAGQSLTRDFNEIEKIQSSVRGSADFARSAVTKAEKILRQELSKARPAYPFAVDGQAEPQGPHFVVSGIDGIVNFTHAVPYFAISAAIVDNSTPLMAVVYNPATDELFFAEKGCGAYKEGFRNHERLR